jgi:hypothetical protein
MRISATQRWVLNLASGYRNIAGGVAHRLCQSLLIQLGVKECILQADDKRADHELTKLRTLIERCGVIVTERKGGQLDDCVVLNLAEIPL